MAVACIGLHLTDRCQLDCKHCLRDPQQKPVDLPLSIVRKVLADPSYRESAERIQAELAAKDAATTAATLLERLAETKAPVLRTT